MLTVAQSQNLEKIDSLKQELQKSDSNKFDVLFSIYKFYYPVNKDSALHYSEESLRMALKTSDSLGIVRSLHSRGDMKVQLGMILQGIGDMEIALGIAKRRGYVDRSKYILNALALAHTRVANYDKALDCNFQSLKIREEIGNPMEISIAQNNVGIVYLALNDYENALLFFEKSLKMKLQNRIEYDIERCYINIGLAAISSGDYERAIMNLNLVIKKCEEKCDAMILMEAQYAIGKAYQSSGNWVKAINALNTAIRMAEDLNSVKYKANALSLLARIQLTYGGNPELALELIGQSQRLIVNTNFRDDILNNYEVLTDIYSQLGDYRNASIYQQKYIDLNKEIFSKDLIKNISTIQSAYEERENLKTIAAKDQVLTLQQDIIARQKSQYAFIITITFLSIGLALVMYRANQFQRKANQQLAVAKETIQNQNLVLEQQVKERTKELFESNESLSKANDELDNFIYKTSHDIRGPLASLKGMCNVAMLDVKDKLALQYLEKLDTSAAKLNAILSRLLIINQINHSLLNPAYLNIEEQIQEILELEKKKGVPERMQISYEVQKGLSFRSDREMAKIILENLIDNAIKFHNESERVEPFVRIRVAEEDSWIVVRVTDNGIGIRNESKEQIFHLFVRASERSDTGGIGLYLSKLATLKLGGAIQLSTTSEGYTEFTVRFPKDLVPIIEARGSEHLKLPKDKQINLNRS